MMEMIGIIDFDLVQTVIVLLNEENQVDPDHTGGAQSRQTNPMRPSTPNRQQRQATNGASEGPQKFKIEVKGGTPDLVFIFMAASHKALLMWFNALITNWTAGKAM